MDYLLSRLAGKVADSIEIMAPENGQVTPQNVFEACKNVLETEQLADPERFEGISAHALFSETMKELELAGENVLDQNRLRKISEKAHDERIAELTDGGINI